LGTPVCEASSRNEKSSFVEVIVLVKAVHAVGVREGDRAGKADYFIAA
jgi:hypothetical protein